MVIGASSNSNEASRAESRSEVLPRSDDVTVSNSVSAKPRIRVSVSMDTDPRVDDDCSISQSQNNHKISIENAVFLANGLLVEPLLHLIASLSYRTLHVALTRNFLLTFLYIHCDNMLYSECISCIYLYLEKTELIVLLASEICMRHSSTSIMYFLFHCIILAPKFESSIG